MQQHGSNLEILALAVELATTMSLPSRPQPYRLNAADEALLSKVIAQLAAEPRAPRAGAPAGQTDSVILRVAIEDASVAAELAALSPRSRHLGEADTALLLMLIERAADERPAFREAMPAHRSLAR